MSNLTQAISGNEALKGTFIQDLFETMNGGGRPIDDLRKLEEGEISLGVMDDFERALYFLIQKYAKREKGITNRLHQKTESSDQKSRRKLEAEIKSCQSRLRIAINLMWENIETRLADQMPDGCFGWRLRSGFQIAVETSCADNFSKESPNELVFPGGEWAGE